MDKQEINICACEIHDAADRIYGLIGTSNPTFAELQHESNIIGIALRRLTRALYKGEKDELIDEILSLPPELGVIKLRQMLNTNFDIIFDKRIEGFLRANVKLIEAHIKERNNEQ